MPKYDLQPFDATTTSITQTVERMSFDAWDWRCNMTDRTLNQVSLFFDVDRGDVEHCFNRDLSRRFLPFLREFHQLLYGTEF